MRHDHTGTLTLVLVHKFDREQFEAFLDVAKDLVKAIGSSNDPEKLKALTAQLKTSADALEAVVKQNSPPTPTP